MKTACKEYDNMNEMYKRYITYLSRQPVWELQTLIVSTLPPHVSIGSDAELQADRRLFQGEVSSLVSSLLASNSGLYGQNGYSTVLVPPLS